MLTLTLNNRCALLLSLILAAPQIVRSQGEIRFISRPDAELIVIRFENPSTTGIRVEAQVFVPSEGLESVNSAEFTSPQDLAIHLRPETALRVEQAMVAKRRPAIYLAELMLNGEKVNDLFVTIPSVMSPAERFKVRTRGTVKDRSIVLEEVFVAPEFQAAKLRAEFWTVEVAGKEYPVRSVTYATNEPTEPRLVLELAKIPPNGSPVKIYIEDPALKVAKTRVETGTTQDAPVATEKDPTGNADFYAAFLWSNSNDTGNIFGADLAARFTVWQDYWVGGRTYLSFAPEFTAKINSNEKDDEDSLSLSLGLEGSRLVAIDAPIAPHEHERTDPGKLSRWIESFPFRVSPKYEFDKGLRNQNLVFDGEVGLRTKVFGWSKANERALGLAFDFAPFIGFEGGRNLQNNVTSLEGSSIVRLKGGATALLAFEVKKPFLDTVKLDLSFIHRQLFRQELFTQVSRMSLPPGILTTMTGQMINVSGGTLQRNEVSMATKGPRNYVSATLKFGLTPSSDYFVSYVYGALPPKFERVDKFQMGLAYRFNFAYF